MLSSLRRVTAAAVCFSLVLTCAGLEPYAAFGASFNRAPDAARVPTVELPRLPVLPAAALPSTLLSAPVLPGVSSVGGALSAPAPLPAAASQLISAPAQAAAAGAARAEPARADAPASASASASAARPSAETLKSRADARFDGAAARAGQAPTAVPAAFSTAARPALAKPTVFKRAKKTLAIAALATALAASGFVGSFVAKTLPVAPATFIAQVGGPTGAPQGPPTQQQQPGQQPQQQPAQTAAPDTAQAPVVLSQDLAVSARFSRQGLKVGERLQLVVTVKNQTAQPVTVTGLRGSLEDALPEALELEAPAGPQAQQADAPFTLKPGESREVSYEAIPFDSGDLDVEGPVTITVQAAGGESRDLDFALPKQTLKVASILTPDWKKQGFRDAAGVMKRQVPEWVWVVALPLLAVLLIGIERVLAAQREFPRLRKEKIPLVVRARERLAALGKELDAPERVFYAEFDSILTGFLVDFHGLTTAERTPADLARALKKVRTLSPGQLEVAGSLLRLAEEARFSGRTIGADERRRDLANLSDLVDSIAGKAAGAAAPKPGVQDLPAAAGLQFGHPLALLLFLPLIARALWSFANRNKKDAFTVSDAASLPGKRSLRQRLLWLPKALRAFAVASILIALSHPQLGVRRDVVWRPSTDTMIEFDVSGSMDEQVGQNLTKLQAAGEAAKGYIDEQRRGTDNRVGLGTFSDNAYLDVRLTTDYDALIAHLKELHTLGSTAVGKAMLDATAHFIELNITELNDASDPRMAEAQKILREQGLPAVLEYAKQYPDLMQKILRPDRAKVVVLFTDGESNSGIDPADAAKIAKGLGVKVYTVFIGPDGGAGIGPLQQVAQITGAKYFRAADPDAMRGALLEVDKLEKSPSRVVSSLSLKDYSQWFVLMALLALGLEVGLANTRLRALQAMLILSLPLGTLPGLPSDLTTPPAIVAQAGAPLQKALPVTGVPKDVAEANLLYNEGRYDEALKAYDEALRLHPDMAELYFNMGDAYLRLGELDKAASAYQRFLGKTQDKALSSRAVYNLSIISLAKKDAEQAKALLKESLRRDSGNEDARWNLEVLNQLQKQQQQNQQQNQKQKKGKKGQKGQQKGQPQQGDQKGDQKQQGQPQQGQPGSQQGQPQDAKDKDKTPADKLGEKLGEQQKEQQDAARKAIPRKGHDSWGALALPLAAAGGTALSFSSPLWAVAAAVVAPVVALLLAYGLHQRLKAARALSPGTAPADFRSWWGRKRFLRKAALLTTAAAMLTLAAGDPKSGYTDERVNFGGKDVIVAVDGSASTIYAEDGRFANTKKELAEFAERLQGTDRVGLIVFSGEARTASPLSVDYGNLQYKVERLERESMGLQDGSKLAEAVEFAAKSFETAKDIGDRDRILVIVSDGEIFGEDLDKAIETARQHHVTIYTIGVGSERGVKMKVPTEDGSGTQYVQDDQASGDALTKLDEAPLRRLAAATGGAYFRGGDGATLAKVMTRVAESNKGRHAETIRSPRGAAEIFLWPALAFLALDMLLPGFSVFRRNKKQGKKTKLNGAALGLIGLSALPLSSWPVILPFAVVSAIFGGLLAADIWTDGALTRRLVWALQRRRGFVPKGVAADLPRLLTTRELDQQRLERFVKAWQRAPDAARGALIEQAAADEELAREKLIAAYLSGGEPATQERALTALGRTARAQLKPAAPVARLVFKERDAMSWTRHGDAAKALGRLAQAFLDPAEAAAERRALGLDAPAAGWRPSVKGLAKRALLGAALAVAVGSLSLAGASGWKTAQYVQERDKAAEASTQLFFSEDAFIFSDRYVDDRIPQYVLPALRRWSDRSAGAQEELERAVKILAESPDPKADNVLEAVLRRSDMLPLDSAAEKQLLTSLVLRDNDHVWRFMDELLQNSAGKPAMTAKLKMMLVIALESGQTSAFERSFHFLKSPDEDFQNFAAQAIFSRLLEYGKQGQFYDRLGAAQSRYAADPELQLFAERFLLMQAAGGKGMGYDSTKASPLLDKTLDVARAWDASRAPFLAQVAAAAKQAQAQGKPFQAPEVPCLSALEIQMLGEAASVPDAPDALKDLAKAEVDRATTILIKDAEAKIPGLHEKLVADGVVLADTQNYLGGYGEFEGYGGGYSGGVTRNYRDIYKLQHLRALQEDIQAKAREIQSNAAEQPEFLELMDRSAQTLPQLLKSGQAAGMLDGNSPAEKAADDVNNVLAAASTPFSGQGFLNGLRAKGLAPDNGATTGMAQFREAYTLEQMRGVRAYLYELAVSGQGFNYDGTRRPLTVAERKYLAGALDQMSALLSKHYGVKAADEPAPEALTIARVSARAEKAAGDSVKERALLDELVRALASPYGAKATNEEISDALDSIFRGAPDGAARAAMVRSLAAAVEGKPSKSAAAQAAQARVKDQFAKLESELNEAFPGFNAKAAQAEARSGEYSDYAVLKQVHIRRLTGVVDAAELEAKIRGTLDEKRKTALRDARALIPALLEAAPKTGILPGDTPGERVAAVINPKLYDCYMKFYGQVIRHELIKRGLAPDGTATDVETAYAGSYSKQDLQKVLAFLEDIQKSGQGWQDDDTRRPLTVEEKQALSAAIDSVRGQLQHYPEGKTALHGAAIMGLAPLAFALGVGPLLILASLLVAGAAAFWWWTRETESDAAPFEAPRASGPSADAARRAKRVELAAKRLASSVANGSFRSLFIGAGGSDFAESRPYAGEDRRDIDWKTSAKMGEVYSKKYELEKDMPLILVVDVSGSGAFGTRGEEKRVVIEDAASVLALAAAQLNLRVGAVLVSDKVEAYIPPKNGAQQAREIVRRLQAETDEPRRTDLRPALELALKEVRSRAMVAVVSDFLAPEFRGELAALAQRHDVRAIRVADPAELSPLPDVGLLPVRDGETGDRRELDTHNAEFRAEHAALIERREARLADAFSQARLRPLVLSTEGDYMQELQDAFDPKANPTRSKP